MNDPQRLELGGDDFEAALLRSAKADAPSRHARGRALVALGIAGGLAGSAVATGSAVAAPAVAKAIAATSLGASAAAGAGAAAGAAGAAGATASVAMSATALIVAKWVGIATVAGIGVWGVAKQVQSDPSADAARTAAVTAAVEAVPAGEPGALAAQPARGARPADDGAAAAATTETAGEDDGAEVAPAVEPTVAKTAPAKAPLRPTGTAVAPSTPPPKGLTDEIAALDRARAAMEGGDAEAALRAIEAYQREFSRGTLGPEAEVLRIEALARGGDMATARALARTFLARHPSSPAAQRLQSLIAGGSTP